MGWGMFTTPVRETKEQKGDQETKSPRSHTTSAKVGFYGQSEVLTPNPDNVKAIYISCYSYTFSTTEQPATPNRGVQR